MHGIEEESSICSNFPLQDIMNSNEHPPYSPDLSPCDYQMFSNLKEEFGEHGSDNDTDMEKFMRNWLVLPSYFYFFLITE